ncbi:MAG: urea ABC transporter permease [Candidatus Synechococcus spongiarum 15L]|uniref:Urea ABC transporter permease n=1 Tax=Candidatus Synechococcus spongiarum 15L TaxID=1608419 RepID=A0A0G8ASC7_9SYNE|nr:MAG: urea ABC transporter permease [Candidatus Synechococcus spongiarum 15L]
MATTRPRWQSRWRQVLLGVVGLALVVALPSLVSPFRLNLLGRYLSLAIVALGIDLIWGYTGLLSLGQGIFFALGGYGAAMHLQLNCHSCSRAPGGLPEFFGLYGVQQLPWFWEPFHSPWFTLLAIGLVPSVVAGLLGFLVFRNRIKGVYFSILTQAALLVFFNFFNGQQKLINGTNGLKTDLTRLLGQMVGSDIIQRYLFWLTALLVLLTWLFCRQLVRGRFGHVLLAIRDDEARLRCLGYNPTPFKTMVFALAGGLAGISGALYTVQSGIVSPQFMAAPFSIEMVVWVAVGGRGTLWGAMAGALVINMAKSLVSEVWPQTWLFIQGGLFLLVVTTLQGGVVGWWQEGGPRHLLARLGWRPRLGTYPALELEARQEAED